jgi:hypothetical protein
LCSKKQMGLIHWPHCQAARFDAVTFRGTGLRSLPIICYIVPQETNGLDPLAALPNSTL